MKAHGFLILLAALVSSACLPYPPTEPTAFTPEGTHIQTLALVRPTWDGTRPDAFCVPDIGQDIYRQMKHSLQKRGYQVIDVHLPPLDNSNRPDPLASWDGKQLAAEMPASVDGVFRLRIVEYLDASLCDGGYEIKSLDITAIGEIYQRSNGRKIWESRQLCSDLSRGTSDAVFACTVQLAQRITAHLPPASP